MASIYRYFLIERESLEFMNQRPHGKLMSFFPRTNIVVYFNFYNTLVL